VPEVDVTVLEITISPVGPLGQVLWVEIQYAALKPEGKVAFGTLVNPEAAWVEVLELWCDCFAYLVWGAWWRGWRGRWPRLELLFAVVLNLCIQGNFFLIELPRTDLPEVLSAQTGRW
jgi:hypothetical protein